ncbi:hypothetical protein EAF00_009336 [Botryotinia globosa]|nr:hypothetical protein EAF00_009336 [Botryotinia globosa]
MHRPFSCYRRYHRYMLWSDKCSPCNYFSLCHVQIKSCPRYVTNHKGMTQNSKANQVDIPGPDLESGPRATRLFSSREYPIPASSGLPSRIPSVSEYSSLPSQAHISFYDDTNSHLHSIRPVPHRATNQFQNFAMFVPAMTFATAEPIPKPTIELHQVTQSARFISCNQTWG